MHVQTDLFSDGVFVEFLFSLIFEGGTDREGGTGAGIRCGFAISSGIFFPIVEFTHGQQIKCYIGITIALPWWDSCVLVFT